jgi:selenocysteine lyase/cysteine desulfurase
MSFGKHMKPFFFNGEEFININHGSYGATPRPVMDALQKYQFQMETSCDKWFRETAIKLYTDTVKTVASFVDAPAEDIALVENASVAVNAVLRSLPAINSRKECSIMYTSIAYGMVKQVLYYLRDTNPNISLIEVVLDHTNIASHEGIVTAFKDALVANKDKNIVLAVFDHIASTPSVIFPVKQLGELFREHGVLTLVDGAHAIGQLPLSIRDLAVDFYTSNTHKWLFCPKTSAFLYVRNDLRVQIRPTVVSFGYENKKFDEEFFWCGTRDLSAMFTNVDAIAWRKEIGGEEAIQKYCNELSQWTGDHLAEAWGTTTLFKENCSVMTGALTNVLLPIQDKSKIAMLVKILMDEYHSYMAHFEFDGKWYARISCQIYNTQQDMIQVGQYVKQIIERL